jgi:hypothetical protein
MASRPEKTDANSVRILLIKVILRPKGRRQLPCISDHSARAMRLTGQPSRL